MLDLSGHHLLYVEPYLAAAETKWSVVGMMLKLKIVQRWFAAFGLLIHGWGDRLG